MTIEPFIRCSDITKSLKFYTGILDFSVALWPDPDPAEFMSRYSLLERDGCRLHLSAHSGDGAFGNVIYVRVHDVDDLYRRMVDRGLCTDMSMEYSALRIPLTDQSWGSREFSVTDPDGNKITFGQDLS